MIIKIAGEILEKRGIKVNVSFQNQLKKFSLFSPEFFCTVLDELYAKIHF